MQVEVRLFGTLTRHLPPGARGKQARVELPPSAGVMDLIGALGIPYEVEEGVLVVAVNDEVVPHTAPLREGDVVSMFPPLAGG